MRTALLFWALLWPSHALTIKVDYKYDDAGFFDNPKAREALEAAAARWSRIIDQSLRPVDIRDDAFVDGRFAFIHPATGAIYQVSAAAGPGSDFLVANGRPAADEYLNGFQLGADEWILYAGALPMDDAGRGGPIGPGDNNSLVYDAPDSFLNRDFNKGVDSLTVLGGVVSFDVNTEWNFDIYDAEAGGADFYSIALHELAHCFGLTSRQSDEWKDLVDGVNFRGPKAIAAYVADSGEAVKFLRVENPAENDFHWKDGAFKSRIFPYGRPNLIGTVGLNKPQDLLMEPIADVEVNQRRFEATNVDVAALQDLGWSVISSDPPPGPEVPLEFSPLRGGGLELTIPTQSGAAYTIETSTNGINWRAVVPSLVGNGGPLTWADGQEGFTDPYGSASLLDVKFYRVRKE